MTDATPSSKVLIVDDDELLVKALARICRRAGLGTVGAHNGREALEALDREPIDLIVSDVRMPVMDGHALLRELASRGELPCPIIFLTGYTEVPHDELLALGAERVLAKPIGSSRLRDLVLSLTATG